MFWKIGWFIGFVLLDGKRAEYGKRILTTLSAKLVARYGTVYTARNLRRMAQFAVEFLDIKIVPKLSTQLSWSHIIEPLPQNNHE